MIRLGVIGGIGSGKSFISRLFKSPVFNADKEVEFLYKNNNLCSQIYILLIFKNILFNIDNKYNVIYMFNKYM